MSALIIGNSQAAFDSTDTVKLFTDIAAYKYDSNVFRLSDQQENNSTRKHQQKGDSSLSAGVRSRIDVPLSRQNVYAAADFTYNKYLVFDELNSPAWNVSLGWDWVVGNQLSGNLSAATSRELSSFDDVRISVVDTVKRDSANWAGSWQLLSNFSVLANASYIQESHDVRKFQKRK
ncbi:hypothetical protein GKO28_11945 [Deefgea sp. CFH1-16]|nr:hypothetical protein [Deefgea sp. CFH1-16]